MELELPRIHPREENVNKAKLELMECLGKIARDLTEGEMLKVVTEEMSSWISGIAKYQIRAERHPDNPDQPGGLE